MKKINWTRALSLLGLGIGLVGELFESISQERKMKELIDASVNEKLSGKSEES